MTKCKVCGHTVCDLCDDKCHYCEKYPKVASQLPPKKERTLVCTDEGCHDRSEELHICMREEGPCDRQNS
jgi:hypothetical protein